MMRINRLVAMLTLPFFVSLPLFSDNTIEYTGPMMKKPASISTSGKMQRKESELPFLGRQIIITRVDKGVEWTLNPKKKTYTEKKIALPYEPDIEPTMGNSHNPWRDDTDDANSKCTVAIKKLSKSRTIAGLETAGYWMGCKESPNEGMVVWISNPSDLTKLIQSELKTFDLAYQKELYLNYPEKDRKEILKGVGLWQRMFSEIPHATGSGQLPEDLWLSIEMESPEQGKTSLFEFSRLSVEPLSVSQFEIPAGYKKVADEGMFGLGEGEAPDMNEMMNEMKKLMKDQK